MRIENGNLSIRTYALTTKTIGELLIKKVKSQVDRISSRGTFFLYELINNSVRYS